MSETKNDEDLLADARTAYKRMSDWWDKNRQAWIDDVRFARLNDQWPAAIKKQRDEEGRPCLTVNKLPAFIRQVTNDARQNRPSIKFHAVGSGADQATAKVLDGLTRNIEYTSNADIAYDNALDNAVSGSFGFFRISTDYAADDAFDQDIKIEAIMNPLTVLGPEGDFAADSAEWNMAFITELLSEDDFEKRWPKAEISNFNADDKDFAEWFMEDHVRIAEWWVRDDVPATLLLLTNGEVMFEPEYLKGKDIYDAMQVSIKESRPTTTKQVTQRIITGCEILETNKWAGKYIPIVPVYGDSVVVDGERHLISLVRFAKDPQQMFNFWRTASTELVALAPKTPFIGAVGAFTTDAAKWATANTVSHSHIEYDPIDVAGNPAMPPQRQGFAGPPAGALQEAMNASDDMKAIMGLYDASLGARSNEVSGRAILARQREGDVSTFNFTDNLSRAIRHAGRIIADLIPKVYSTARMLRVIHEDGTNQQVPINGMQPPPQQPGAQQPQAMSMTPEEQQGIAHVYDLTTGKYDVTCEAGPSYTTKREESADQMMQFIQAYPQAGPLIGDLLAKALDWQGADEIAERLKKMLPPQLQGQDPQSQAAQQQIQQLSQQLAEMQKQLHDKDTDHQIDVRKTEIDAYNAETNRIKAMAPGFGPEQVAAVVQQTVMQVLSSPDVLPGPAPAAAPQGMQPPGPAPGMPPGPAGPQPQQEPPQGGFFPPEGQPQ